MQALACDGCFAAAPRIEELRRTSLGTRPQHNDRRQCGVTFACIRVGNEPTKLPELSMAATSTDISKPATVTEIRTARVQDREAQPSDEKRMVTALEEIADTTEAIRQEIVHFENLVERLILAQRALF
jgi:hypothetical protein